jgi:glycosyltransferase involved in cell wall biosynthesis
MNNNKPKLLQINVVSNLLSTGIIAEDIANVAYKRGWDCYIAFARASKPGICKEIKIGCKVDTYIHYIENRLFDREGLSSRLATLKLVKVIKGLNPQIVHLHIIHDHYLNYKILFNYLNQTDIKVVWTFHDFWAITGHCHHFIDANCEKWKTQCDKCPLQHSTVNSCIDRSKRNYELKKQLFTANKNLTIVPVSYWVGGMVKQSFLKDKRIEVIPNGINFELFNQTDTISTNRIPRNKFIILAVARGWSHADRKGFDDYFRLSQLLKEDEIIVMVGIKPYQMDSLPNNIIGVERTHNQEELISIYRKADVLISMSKAETFGLTVIEANACGTPAIVYNNTAPPLLVTPETGFVAENGNVEEVYSKIQQIKKMGKSFFSEACINHVKKNYNKDINFNKYIDLYEDISQH